MAEQGGWVYRWLSPQVVIAGASMMFAVVVGWDAMATRVAVIESTLQSRLIVAENRIQYLEAEQKRLLDKSDSEREHWLDVLRERISRERAQIDAQIETLRHELWGVRRP